MGKVEAVPLAFREAGLGDNAVDYLDAWEMQGRVHAGVAAGGKDTVLLLEHPPAYTAGTRTDAHERPVDYGGDPVIDVNRGGKITFRGPGQLVGYPHVKQERKNTRPHTSHSCETHMPSYT